MNAFELWVFNASEIEERAECISVRAACILFSVLVLDTPSNIHFSFFFNFTDWVVCALVLLIFITLLLVLFDLFVSRSKARKNVDIREESEEIGIHLFHSLGARCCYAVAHIFPDKMGKKKRGESQWENGTKRNEVGLIWFAWQPEPFNHANGAICMAQWMNYGKQSISHSPKKNRTF